MDDVIQIEQLSSIEGVLPLIIGFVVIIGGQHSKVCGERNLLLSDKTMLIDTLKTRTTPRTDAIPLHPKALRLIVKSLFVDESTTLKLRVVGVEIYST